MARKRMFDCEIISQDSFFDLPMEAKALYFLLGMEADDEGFVNYKKVLRLYGGTEDSLKILAMKGFIIPFKSGVIVITDWKINNYLDKKRVKETIYKEEKNQLNFNEITKKYELLTNPLKTSVKQMFNKCLERREEKRVEENRLEENRLDDDDVLNNYYSSSSTTSSVDEIDRQPVKKTSIESTTTVSDIDGEQQHQTSESSKSLDDSVDRQPVKKTSLSAFNLENYLKNNFNREISEAEITCLSAYTKTFDNDVIKEAIDRACIKNAKTTSYVLGILKSWKSKGFKTLNECLNEVPNSRQKNEPEPEWLNQEIKSKEIVYDDELKRELKEFEQAIEKKK